jgi:peroxiredoxin/rhodanese-related sulfurtransferase
MSRLFFSSTLVSTTLVLGLCPLIAAEPESDSLDIPAGHSYHGEAFNEGPRQKAYLMEGIGNVSFPATTKSQLVQKFINQGVGQLHGFWYFEAERSFRQAASIDPECAVSYWGMAMSNINNLKRGQAFIAEAVKRKKGITAREAMYIDALSVYFKTEIGKDKKKKTARNKKYAKSFERIYYKFPDDLEAKAFLALKLWVNRSDVPIQSYLAASALLHEVLEKKPMHPCHHYIIHLWDLEKPEYALTSAGLCGQSAPGIAHMWHMPGHIYSRLKRYQDASWQQEASARVDHAHMIRDRVLPDQISNFAHNNEWLIRNLIHVGRMQDGMDLAKNMIELPRHPKYNQLKKKKSAYYGRLRLYEVLNRFELWDELIALTETPYLEETELHSEQVKRIRYIGRAYFKKGDVEQGKAQLAILESLIQDEESASEQDTSESKEKANSKKEPDTRLRNLKNAVNELKGRAAIAAGDKKTGFPLVKEAGHVVQTNLAQLYLAAGMHEEAEKTVRDYLKGHKNEVLTLAHLVEILWKSEKKEEAEKTFKQLQELAGVADLDAPVLTRLAPIAEQLGFSLDWRKQQPQAEDIGNRPDLDSLGPFRWHPYEVPDFALKDVNGKTFSLKQFRGKPVIVIFYLGYGCLHCAEQLQAFAPATEKFSDAGISLIAVSTDNQEQLKKSHDNYTDGVFPFPLVANSSLDVFKKFRTYDDFEKQTLHGTYLIDAEGMVRWQDISYEPFMDPDFVLKEAHRLLAQKSTYEVAFLAEDADATKKQKRPFQPGKHTKDSLEKVQKLLKENKAIILDVREKSEWNAGHLKGAKLVPLSELRKNAGDKEYAKKLGKKVSKNKIIYCHCRSGGRVIPASKILYGLGYDIRPLKFGYSNLRKAGFPKSEKTGKE